MIEVQFPAEAGTPIQWAPGSLYPGGDADHPPPSSAEVKNA